MPTPAKLLSVLLTLLFSLSFTARFSQIHAQGKVKGISDALKKYRTDSVASQSQALNEIRNEYRQLKDIQSEVNSELVKKEEEVFLKTKERLLETIEKTIEHLQKLKNNISLREATQVAILKDRLTVWIDNEILWLSDLKLRVERAKTTDELQTAYQDLRSRRVTDRQNWIDTKKEVAQNLTAQMEKKIDKAETLIKKYQEKIQSFKDRGYNTGKAEELILTLQNDLFSAKQKIIQAQKLLESEPMAEEYWSDLKKLFMEVQQIFRKIMTNFDNIVRLVNRDQRSQITISPTRQVRSTRIPTVRITKQPTSPVVR